MFFIYIYIYIYITMYCWFVIECKKYYIFLYLKLIKKNTFKYKIYIIFL